MPQASSFIAVKRVNVDYSGRQNAFGKLLGKAPLTHSVLRDLSFKLQLGDHVIIFGREGTGKSTLLRLLTGILSPSAGKVVINGQAPQALKDLAAGYISTHESEPSGETVHTILHTFGTTHNIANLPARLGEIAEEVGIQHLLSRVGETLSTVERLRVNIARAALSDTPLILLDDVADFLGVLQTRELLEGVFHGRTVIITTRQVRIAEELSLPLFILHNAHISHAGTCDEIANAMSCPRILDVWVEGLRYDLLRKLRQHPGVLDVRLVASSRFAGQKLRITTQSARYLPSLYDLISQAPLVRVQEVPASLKEIVDRLSPSA